MCGIAGVLGLGADLNDEDRRHLRQMTAVLRHRGPDSSGHFSARRCELGNARLKVIDLSERADLPMSTADGAVWIAYNGEVTNFRELERKYDLRRKYPLRTSSDTEVLLYLYEELGIDFCRELTGMFAFCLFDQRLNKAYVVRDFYGIRPLFTMRAGDRLYFASEIKAFLDLPGFDGQLDEEGLYHYFSLAYIPEHHTPFRQIRELQGGRLVEVDLNAGRVEERDYYEVRYEPEPGITEAGLAEALFEQMRDSVRRNLISDAPLGLTLSGGVDTSSILALARDLVGDADIHTFSVVMQEASFDESRFQHLMVDPRSPTHHEILVGPREVEADLCAHMAYMDEPSGDGAAIPSFRLAREAKKHVKVLLSGEGGDETFNAYETHLACKVRGLYRRFVPKPVRWAAYHAAHALPCDYRKLSFDFVAKRFTEGAEMSVPEAHLHWRHVLPEQDKRDLMPGLGHLPPTATLFSRMYESVDFADDLNRISLMDLKHYFIGDLMVKNDRTMMAHSIEARFPFMDRLLLEFVSRIPPNLRIKGLERRYLQKQAMKPLLPPVISRRKNMGLEMPHSLWFLNEMRPLAERYFSKASVERAGLLHYPVVQRLWQEHLERKRDNGRALWCILNLLVWLELFVLDRSYKQYLGT